MNDFDVNRDVVTIAVCSCQLGVDPSSSLKPSVLPLDLGPPN